MAPFDAPIDVDSAENFELLLSWSLLRLLQCTSLSIKTRLVVMWPTQKSRRSAAGALLVGNWKNHATSSVWQTLVAVSKYWWLLVLTTRTSQKKLSFLVQWVTQLKGWRSMVEDHAKGRVASTQNVRTWLGMAPFDAPIDADSAENFDSFSCDAYPNAHSCLSKPDLLSLYQHRKAAGAPQVHYL